MKLEDFKVGMRVHTLVSMASEETHHLAAKEGTVVKINPKGLYQIYVDIDGFYPHSRLGDETIPMNMINPIPFMYWELGEGNYWWNDGKK